MEDSCVLDNSATNGIKKHNSSSTMKDNAYLCDGGVELNTADDASRNILVIMESGEDIDNIRIAAVTLWRKDDRETILVVDGVGLVARVLAACRAIAVG